MNKPIKTHSNYFQVFSDEKGMVIKFSQWEKDRKPEHIASIRINWNHVNGLLKVVGRARNKYLKNLSNR